MSSLVKPKSISLNHERLTKKAYRYQEKNGILQIPFGYGLQTISIVLPGYDVAKGVYRSQEQPAFGTPLDLDVAPKPGSPEQKLASGDLQVGKTAFVDLRPFCNMGFVDEKAGDHHGGMHDDGGRWNFPIGNQVFRGVPFAIVDPKSNQGRSCIVMYGSHKKFFPKTISRIPVNQRFRRLFFFHGTAWTPGSGTTVLTYRLHYEGKKEVSNVDIRAGVQIGEWKSQKADQLPDYSEARAVRLFPSLPGSSDRESKGVSGYVYAHEITVRAPGTSAEGGVQRALARLEAIEVISHGSAVPLIFAISGELAAAGK